MSREQAFKESQRCMTAHLRSPEKNAAPAGIEDRRLGIYRELIYNNIESFISGGFPILRQILTDDHWHAMVRDFVEQHESHSPYFLEISQEFLQYLQQERGEVAGDPPFMLELAHYEWVELALDVSQEEIPEAGAKSAVELEVKNLLDGHPEVSPLAWCLSYQYPVHRLGPGYKPEYQPDYEKEAPTEQPTFLVVYRNRADEVQFMEANAVTVRLLQLLQGDTQLSGRMALTQIGEELQHPDLSSLLQSGQGLLEKLFNLDIIVAVS